MTNRAKKRLKNHEKIPCISRGHDGLSKLKKRGRVVAIPDKEFQVRG